MLRKNDENLKKRLDHAGRRVVESTGLSDEAVNAVASSPFFFARIRAEIAREAPNQDFASWSTLRFAALRAVPAMALAAAVSFGFYIYLNGNKSAAPAFSVDAYLGAGGSGIDNLVIAERRLTDEEVLRAVVSRDDREAIK